MQKKEIKEEELEKVTGGYTVSKGDKSYGSYHVNCGGIIMNMMNPFASCCCAKCHEEHYFANQFNKYIIYKSYDGIYRREYDDGHREFIGKDVPPELNDPCNQ